MKTARILIPLALLVLVLTGCTDGPPPKEILDGAVVRAVDRKVYARSFGAIKGGVEELGEVVSIVTTNERTQENDEHTVYAYDYETTVNFNDRAKRVWSIEKDQGTYTGTVKLYERDGSWYPID